MYVCRYAMFYLLRLTMKDLTEKLIVDTKSEENEGVSHSPEGESLQAKGTAKAKAIWQKHSQRVFQDQQGGKFGFSGVSMEERREQQALRSNNNGGGVVGWEQMMQGLEDHCKDFGVYYQGNEEPLKSSEEWSDMN